MSTPTPVPPPTMIEQIEAALERALTKAKTEESTIVAWIKNHWPHIPTWALLAYGFFKHLL